MKNNRFYILVIVAGAALTGAGLDTGLSALLYSGLVCCILGFFEWMGT